MLAWFGVIIITFAFIFLIHAIDKHEVLSALISLLLWVISAYVSVNAEIVNNGTIFVMRDKILLLFSGVMALIAGVIAGLIYVNYLREVEV